MSKRSELPEAVLQFFREQGRVGGLKRAKQLSAEQRSEAARRAVEVRWAKKNDSKKSCKKSSKKNERQ